MKALDTVQNPSPFTISWLRKTIKSLGGKGYPVPSEPALARLAVLLNMGASLYPDPELARAARAARARAAKMDRTLRFQKSWFDDRQKELEAVNIPPEFVESETQLRDKFNAFVDAMASHAPTPGLPMDVWLLSPLPKNWRAIAEYIADAFVQAMEESNPGLGFWDDGPAVKFTLAALELIGIAPRVYSLEIARRRVAQRIREIKAKKKRMKKPPPALIISRQMRDL